MNALQVLQNNAARIILDMHPNSSVTEALKPLHQRRLFHRNIFMYKCKNNPFEHDHNTRSKELCKPRAKRRCGHWTCTTFASTDWNNIDFTIRNAESLRRYQFL